MPAGRSADSTVAAGFTAEADFTAAVASMVEATVADTGNEFREVFGIWEWLAAKRCQPFFFFPLA